MAYETKPNTGSLFKNDKRETEKHPNAKGQALIGGVEYWVSAWTNESNDGKKYQSLKFEPKEQQAAPQGRSPQKSGFNNMEDDIPF